MEFTYKEAIELPESFVNDPSGLKISDLDYIISQVSTVDTTVSEDAMYHMDIFRVLMRLLRKQTNAYSCGAGISQLTVSADGKILPCPKYAGLGFDMEISDTVWKILESLKLSGMSIKPDVRAIGHGSSASDTAIR